MKLEKSYTQYDVDKIDREYISCIESNEGISQRDLSRKIGHNESRVYNRLRELERLGLVRLERGRRSLKCYPVKKATVSDEATRPGADA